LRGICKHCPSNVDERHLSSMSSSSSSDRRTDELGGGRGVALGWRWKGWSVSGWSTQPAESEFLFTHLRQRHLAVILN
jgi:hypothetical protein